MGGSRLEPRPRPRLGGAVLTAHNGRMPRIQLTGTLVCANEEQATIVATHLPRHVDLTRAEAGCIRFDVTLTNDPLVWAVAELFATEEAFRAHQERVAASEWGTATAGIERNYTIVELAD